MRDRGQLSVSSLFSRVSRIYVIGICFLAPLTAVKVADIQPVEVFSFLALLGSLVFLFRSDVSARVPHDVLAVMRRYGVFFVLVVGLALWNLRLPSFPLRDLGVLKTAPYLSLARLVQLTMAAAALVLVAVVIARRPGGLLLATQCYVYAGVISSAYAIVSWFALLGGVELGGAYFVDFTRASGTFGEGGPFGVYLVSVLLVCIFRRFELRRGIGEFWYEAAILGLAFLLSSSKAGMLLAITLLLYYAVLRRKVRYLLVFSLLIVPAMLASNTIGGLQGYAQSYANFDERARESPDDVNLVMGRSMGLILVPIMVLAHPVTGVGLGNYSLQRNNPDYLGSVLPEAVEWDLPGLGLLGYVAELGIPLFLFLCWLLWRPVSLLRRSHASALSCVLGAYQILAHLFGVQLNFAYPWIVSGMALGYSIYLKDNNLGRDWDSVPDPGIQEQQINEEPTAGPDASGLGIG